jgi:hypothetical protein
MNSTTTSRIAAAVMSVTVTLLVVNAIALYAKPRAAASEAHVAGKTESVVVSASKFAGIAEVR